MALVPWEIAAIMIGGCVSVALIIVVVCKILSPSASSGDSVWKITRCLETGDENKTLTKHEQSLQDYKDSSESEFILDGSGKYVQYDTLSSDIKAPGDNCAKELDQLTPEDETSRASSPAPSVGDSSVASEYEGSQQGMSRTLSCESIMSDFDIMEVEPEQPRHGQIEFGLEYDREVGELIVSVIQARDLQANEYSGSLDTYVWVLLMPDQSARNQTQTQKDTINPVYKERFLYNVGIEELDQKQLQFQMYSVDRFARPKLIGEAELKIGDIDITAPVKVWMNLRDIDEEPQYNIGDIMFSLSYLPTAERLTVVIVKARNLLFSSDRAGDPYVRVYLVQNGKKSKKKKTSVKRGEGSPIYNEAMIFKVPSNSLQDTELRISVAEQSPGGKNVPVGHVIVGPKAAGTELAHWNQMITSLRKPASAWHALCPPK